jgi:hypothetical protein
MRDGEEDVHSGVAVIRFVLLGVDLGFDGRIQDPQGDSVTAATELPARVASIRPPARTVGSTNEVA